MRNGRTEWIRQLIPASTWSLLLVVALHTQTGCRPRDSGDGAKDTRVVVYTSVDRIFAEPVLREAEKRLGIRVIGVYDTEETKSTGLVNRLIARKDNPDGDLFWSGDPGRAALLKEKGMTVAYTSAAAENIPALFRDPEQHWIGFSARARVLLVNNALVPAGAEPKSIFDLVKPEWKGKFSIANPLFGTTSFHVAALFERIGAEQARAWLQGIKANGVVVCASNGEVKRQVCAGQVAVGLTDTDDAAEALADGQPVRVVYLDQVGGDGSEALGTLVMPNTLSLIRGGPNPESAKRVFDFLLSEEVQTMLAISCAQMPLSSDVPAPPNVRTLTEVVPMRMDYGATGKRLDTLLAELKTWVDSQ